MALENLCLDSEKSEIIILCYGLQYSSIIGNQIKLSWPLLELME